MWNRLGLAVMGVGLIVVSGFKLVAIYRLHVLGEWLHPGFLYILGGLVGVMMLLFSIFDKDDSSAGDMLNGVIKGIGSGLRRSGHIFFWVLVVIVVLATLKLLVPRLGF